MNRAIVLGVGAAALVAAIAVTWVHVRQQREYRRLLAVGDLALAQDQTSDAVEAFSGAIALERGSMLAYLKRGDTYRRRGDLRAALRDLRQAEALDPTAPQPAELLGDVNADMARVDEAVRSYQRYLSLDDGNARVLYKLATVYYRTGQHAPAIDALRRAIAANGHVAEAHYLLGLCLHDTHHEQEAIREETEAIAIDRSFTPAHEALADMYDVAGRRREQIDQLEALAALEPNNPERLVALGLTYAHLGLTDAATTTLADASERYPMSPAVATATGRVFLEIADARHDRTALDRALDALEPLASREDATSDVLTLYGRALLLSGNVRAAEGVLTRAASREPVDAAAYAHLADAARRLGHRDAAREAAARYAALR
jgi:tetratricopeptide (TPR) repeat protein